MFQIGEFVVYGFGGVCRIEEITEMEVPGSTEKKQYYILHPLKSNANRVYAPVSGKKVIRAVISGETAEELLKLIPEITPLEVTQEKRREEIYKEALRLCEPVQWVKLLKTLTERKEKRTVSGKQSTAMDSRYLRSVEDHLFTELSVVLGMELGEVEEMLYKLI